MDHSPGVDANGSFAPAPNDTPSEQQPPRQSLEGGVKETIESILVAFILAFIFRAYVVEAFVIPTGSMAPTLLGAHMRFRCPDCGYRFDVNYQGIETGDDVQIPTSAGPNRVFAIFCPNCGFRLPRNSPEDPANDATDPAVRYGDRILVLKYLYLFQDPKRWDVVVFKSPVNPTQTDYQINYIKRLTGRPGESVMILDGDVYVSPSHSDDPQELLRSFKVQTKPRKVQDALWRIVYNNDYYPRGLDRTNLHDRNDNLFSDVPFTQPWKPKSGETGWTLGDGTPGHRDFVFNNPAGAATLYFDSSANPRRQLVGNQEIAVEYALTDWLAYDVTEIQQRPDADPDNYRSGGYEPRELNNVSDVKLEFTYLRTEGSGPLRVQLTKREHTFEAQLFTDKAVLLMDGKPLSDPAPLPHRSGPMHVEMINADYRASLWVDGKELLATTPQQYAPDIPRLLEEYRREIKPEKAKVQIIGQQQACTLSHISLWRDIYYINNTPQLKHAMPRDFPRNVMRLQPDQFFVLGDNSKVSLDARYWDEPINLPREGLDDIQSGCVPRQFMLGKAFFVYWPAGYRPINSAPALAPNFGDMRFIH
jgi:signal peptidase I